MQKRNALIQEQNPTCPGCDDGRLHAVDETGGRISVPCSMMKMTCVYAQRLIRRRNEQLVSSLYNTSLPAIHVQRISHFNETPALHYARNWDYVQRPFLALLGERGVGKSFAAAYAFLIWLYKQDKADSWKRSESWKDLSELAASALRWMHIFKVVNDREAVEEAVKAQFLVIDDIASEDATPQAKARINYIISSKYDQQRPMIITGNMSEADLRERYGDRIFDRLGQCGYIATCDGENLRL